MRLLPAVVVAGFIAGAAMACDTPVYRYAMYSWKTTPYQVFYFHNPAGKDADAKEANSAKVNRLLLELSTSTEPANVKLIEVDTTDQKSIKQLPQAVAASWKQFCEKNNAKKSGGVHIIFSPWGREFFAGRLDVDMLRAMTESPARKRLGELLAEGKLVAVCLNSKQETDKIQVDEAIRDLANRATDDDASRVEVARLDVSTSDPRETWFVRDLMLVEPDLNEYIGQPILFMCYGRGRSMLPYIGKGITADNLARCVSFLTGDCSCEVKADNPGVDLLMRCNWEAAADAMAANDDKAPTRDGELTYREFDPSQLSNNQSPESRKPALENDIDGGDETVAVSIKPLANAEDVEPALIESFAARQTWLVGGGLVVVVIVVLIGGLFVMRRSAGP